MNLRKFIWLDGKIYLVGWEVEGLVCLVLESSCGKRDVFDSGAMHHLTKRNRRAIKILPGF